MSGTDSDFKPEIHIPADYSDDDDISEEDYGESDPRDYDCESVDSADFQQPDLSSQTFYTTDSHSMDENSHSVSKQLTDDREMDVGFGSENKLNKNSQEKEHKFKWIASWIQKPKNDCGDDVQARIRTAVKKKEVFWVDVDGYFRKSRKAGYGVIIHDYHHKPIVAYSVVVSDPDGRVSAFYHELQGVNKGLELAIKYELDYIKMSCTSSDVSYFLTSSRALMFTCSCGGKGPVKVTYHCRNCLKNRLFVVKGQLEKTCDLACEILDKLSSLGDDVSFDIIPIGRRDNTCADYLAKLGDDKGEMRPYELVEYEELLNMIYERARRFYCARRYG